MLRVLVASAGIPFLLVAVLAVAMDMQGGRLGSLTSETFVLGLLPLVLFVLLVGLLVFVPGILLLSRITDLSIWKVTSVGLLSALLPVVATALSSTWPVISDSNRRFGFRMQYLVDSILNGYPWLFLGVAGGLLFWLLAIARNRAFARHFRRHP
jgi:hypothetical protein